MRQSKQFFQTNFFLHQGSHKTRALFFLLTNKNYFANIKKSFLARGMMQESSSCRGKQPETLSKNRASKNINRGRHKPNPQSLPFRYGLADKTAA